MTQSRLSLGSVNMILIIMQAVVRLAYELTFERASSWAFQNYRTGTRKLTLSHATCMRTHPIAQFRYIKIQPKTIDLSARLRGISPTNSVVIPRSLVLRRNVLG